MVSSLHLMLVSALQHTHTALLHLSPLPTIHRYQSRVVAGGRLSKSVSWGDKMQVVEKSGGYYRPQTKFAKVMLLRSLSVGGGLGLCPGGSLSQGGLCPGVSFPGGLCPGGALSRGFSV